MLEAKYYRDYKHNYMILQCGQEGTAGSYQYKILTSGKIGEILKCAVRHMNGTTYYYYDISSRTTLESLYRDKKMSYVQIKDLLCQLHGICDKLSGYFMEEAGLVLMPEHIYYDLTNRRYIGLYYPGYRAAGAEAYRPLTEFLLEHVDTEDRRLTEAMYRICEAAEESYFTIEDALQILEEPEKEDAQNRYEHVSADAERFGNVERLSAPLSAQEVYERMSAASGGRFSADGPACESKPDAGTFCEKASMGEALCESTSQGISPDRKIPTGDFSYAGKPEQETFGAKAVHEKRLSGKPDKSSMFYVVFAALSALGIAGALAVNAMYELTVQEEKALYGCVAALGICVAVCIAGCFRGRKTPARKSEKKETLWQEDAGVKNGMASVERFPEQEPQPVSLSNVISRDMDLEMADWGPSNSASGEMGHEGSGRVSLSGAQEEGCGNTIFFDSSKIGECKLYAVDRKNKKHIELTQFPYTIGKMAGCVDYVLPDNSVSRIHARFDRQGDRIFLTDMNSTNGTYKNGLRMQPRETVEIEPGDEVRFGNLNYCYR